MCFIYVITLIDWQLLFQVFGHQRVQRGNLQPKSCLPRMSYQPSTQHLTIQLDGNIGFVGGARTFLYIKFIPVEIITVALCRLILVCPLLQDSSQIYSCWTWSPLCFSSFFSPPLLPPLLLLTNIFLLCQHSLFPPFSTDTFFLFFLLSFRCYYFLQMA